MAHPVAPYARPRNLDATPLADNALEAYPLVLPAVALPVLRRTEDTLAEEAILLRSKGTVVDGLGLRDLAAGPLSYLLGRDEADGDLLQLIDIYVAL
jgi:hypothetical protein